MSNVPAPGGTGTAADYEKLTNDMSKKNWESTLRNAQLQQTLSDNEKGSQTALKAAGQG
ncbi:MULTISPECIES: hypothetical protein [unclassified Inquilinus]|uniref:hypothetical protein n=1 Tax=unclassified Inquilinus TaxID=2645927 RepID=UPI003F93A893